MATVFPHIFPCTPAGRRKGDGFRCRLRRIPMGRRKTGLPALLGEESAVRQSTSTLRTLLGFLSIVAVVPAAWAYVNGGDFHTTRSVFLQKMKAGGWSMSNGREPGDSGVNMLVG